MALCESHELRQFISGQMPAKLVQIFFHIVNCDEATVLPIKLVEAEYEFCVVDLA